MHEVLDGVLKDENWKLDKLNGYGAGFSIVSAGKIS